MNQNHTNESLRRNWRPEPWLTAIVLFFLVVFAVNALMIRLSLQSWTGEVTDEPYRKGLAFNQTLSAQQAQDALGWQVKLEHAPLLVGKQERLQVVIRNAQGQPLRDASLQGV
ncbi:FixH family protein, partial [Candidatus Magnetaquicoccus inordinatus]|uniref:FixH family protein n=1 Tax=Candidatus Magnetaquicoccus inordinatus TaxID=2496818 RepID=UPI00187D5463